MALNVSLRKKEKQSTNDLLKTFTKLVRSSGVINKLRSVRYYDRKMSDYKKKQNALKTIEKTKINQRLQKLGKKK